MSIQNKIREMQEKTEELIRAKHQVVEMFKEMITEGSAGDKPKYVIIGMNVNKALMEDIANLEAAKRHYEKLEQAVTQVIENPMWTAEEMGEPTVVPVEPTASTKTEPTTQIIE